MQIKGLSILGKVISRGRNNKGVYSITIEEKLYTNISNIHRSIRHVVLTTRKDILDENDGPTGIGKFVIAKFHSDIVKRAAHFKEHFKERLILDSLEPVAVDGLSDEAIGNITQRVRRDSRYKWKTEFAAAFDGVVKEDNPKTWIAVEVLW